MQLYVEKRLFSCLSYWLLLTFLPEKQHLSPAKTFAYQAFMMKINHCDSKTFRLRLQGTFPQKTASIPASEGVRQHPVYWWWLCNYVN